MTAHVATTLAHQKSEALEDGIGREVRIDGTLVAQIEIVPTRDRELEQLLGAGEIFVPVAFVHLTTLGLGLVQRPWSKA